MPINGRAARLPRGDVLRPEDPAITYMLGTRVILYLEGRLAHAKDFESQAP